MLKTTLSVTGLFVKYFLKIGVYFYFFSKDFFIDARFPSGCYHLPILELELQSFSGVNYLNYAKTFFSLCEKNWSSRPIVKKHLSYFEPFKRGPYVKKS